MRVNARKLPIAIGDEVADKLLLNYEGQSPMTSNTTFEVTAKTVENPHNRQETTIDMSPPASKQDGCSVDAAHIEAILGQWMWSLV